MVFIAELEFAPVVLGDPLAAVPEMEITGVERGYHDGEFRVIQWATGGDFDRFEAAMAEDPMIKSYRILTTLDDRQLQRVSYEIDPEESVYRIAVDEDIQLLESKITAEQSIVRVRCPSRDALEALLDAFEDQDITVTVRRLYSNITDDGTDDLTERQRETIAHAYQQGYFELPHGTSLEAIGEHLGISRQAVSKHLWGGLEKLVEKELQDRI